MDKEFPNFLAWEVDFMMLKTLFLSPNEIWSPEISAGIAFCSSRHIAHPPKTYGCR